MKVLGTLVLNYCTYNWVCESEVVPTPDSV